MPPRRQQLDIASKTQEYEAWINDTLKRDLGKLYELKARIQADEKDLRELNSLLERTKQSPGRMKTLVDLGAGVQCAAKVEDTSRIYMEVGLGFHVECTLEEAQKLVAKKLDKVKQDLVNIDQRLAEQKSTIKFALQAISELSGLSG